MSRTIIYQLDAMKTPTGYSGTPLIQKLGIKPGQRICILSAPVDYGDLLGPLPAGVQPLARLGKPHTLDFIHFFTRSRVEFEKRLASLKTALAWDGQLWISWPKGASKIQTDMSENVVREIALPLGLVDVKVAAIDEIWSGLKLVYRLEARPEKR